MTNYANSPENIKRIKREAGQSAAIELIAIAAAVVGVIFGLSAILNVIFN